MRRVSFFTLFLSVCVAFGGFSPGLAQPIEKTNDLNIGVKMSPKFVPENAFAMIAFSPSELLQNQAFEWLPVEVLRVYSKEQYGIDSQNISSVKLVWGLSDLGEPQFGMVVQLTEDIQFETLLVSLGADAEPTMVDNRSVYSSGGAIEILHLVDPRTIYFGTPSYLSPVLEAEDGNGPLPSMVKSLPVSPGINVVVAMESIRPMVSAVAMQGSTALAPDLQAIAQLPDLTDSLQLNVSTDGESIQVKLNLTGIDEPSAKSIESTIKDSVMAAQRLAIAEVERSMAEEEASGEMLAASLAYAERLSEHYIQMLTPQRNGKDVTLSVESKLGFAGTSILAGMLVPAMQSARLTAVRMSASNNMKQVLLGLHNFHAAYNKLPPPAITDADGKPLLSWRVALLPFVEEQLLYEQFHLDEPWDSEHNLPFSKKLPAVYGTPGIRLPAGKTVIHAVSATRSALSQREKRAFATSWMDCLTRS